VDVLAAAADPEDEIPVEGVLKVRELRRQRGIPRAQERDDGAQAVVIDGLRDLLVKVAEGLEGGARPLGFALGVDAENVAGVVPQEVGLECRPLSSASVREGQRSRDGLLARGVALVDQRGVSAVGVEEHRKAHRLPSEPHRRHRALRIISQTIVILHESLEDHDLTSGLFHGGTEMTPPSILAWKNLALPPAL
jgi:hypothetical protein